MINGCPNCGCVVKWRDKDGEFCVSCDTEFKRTEPLQAVLTNEGCFILPTQENLDILKANKVL